MKIADQIYHCQISGQLPQVWRLRCHLQIVQSHNGVQTVMVSEMGFEIGWFNPYLVEALATQVVAEFQLDPARLVWLECYAPLSNQAEDGAFSQVTFDWHNGQATNPRWSAIAPEIAQPLTTKGLLPV